MPRPPSRGSVSSPYGMRVNPNDGKYRMHYGEDTLGDGNYAPVTGTVVFAGYDSTGTGLGYAVGVREAASPSVIWWVAHHASLSVGVGNSTIEGVTYLGAKGASGAAKGVHCHTERRVGGAARPGSGTPTNPRDYYTTTAGGGTDPFPEIDYALLRRQKEGIMFVHGVGAPDVAYEGFTDANGKFRLRTCSANQSAIVIGSGLSIQVNDDRLTQLGVEAGGATPVGGLNLVPIVGGSAGLTPAQDAALMGLPAAVDDLPTKGELTQALTSTVALVNEHADTNKDAIIAAIPSGGSGGSASAYSLSLDIEQVPGTATGTATPQ